MNGYKIIMLYHHNICEMCTFMYTNTIYMKTNVLLKPHCSEYWISISHVATHVNILIRHRYIDLTYSAVWNDILIVLWVYNSWNMIKKCME